MRLRDVVKAFIPQSDKLTKIHTIKLRSGGEELICPQCGGDILIVEKDFFEGSHQNEIVLSIAFTCKDKKYSDCSKIIEDELIIILKDDEKQIEQYEIATKNNAINEEEDRLSTLTELVLSIKTLRRLCNGEIVKYKEFFLRYHNPKTVKVEDRATERTRIIKFSVDRELGTITTKDLKLLFENLSSSTLRSFLLSLNEHQLEQLLIRHGWNLEIKRR